MYRHLQIRECTFAVVASEKQERELSFLVHALSCCMYRLSATCSFCVPFSLRPVIRVAV
jgi:hypothetical protein